MFSIVSLCISEDYRLYSIGNFDYTDGTVGFRFNKTCVCTEPGCIAKCIEWRKVDEIDMFDTECVNPVFLGSEGITSNEDLERAFEKSNPLIGANYRVYNEQDGNALWKCETVIGDML